MKADPIIAVNDVQASSKWYQSILSCIGTHGGENFEVLKSDEGEVLLCLHKWGEHEHPTMLEAKQPMGNGLILYFRVSNIEEIMQNAQVLNWNVESEIATNPNSGMREFTLQDPDGYYLMVSEYHNY